MHDEPNLSLVEILSDFDFEEDDDDEAALDHEEECDEPQEGDYTTNDYCRWYQYGKLVLSLSPGKDHLKAVRQHMEQEQFWPDAYYVSDHGNTVLLDLTTKE